MLGSTVAELCSMHNEDEKYEHNYIQQTQKNKYMCIYDLRWRHRWKNNIKVDFKELWCVQTVHEPVQG
jgi:hypothetical protein